MMLFKRCPAFVALAANLLPLPALAELQVPPAGTYRYGIEHSSRGSIGSMTIEVAPHGAGVEVTVSREIEVKVLGLTAYRNNSQVVQRYTDRGSLTYLERKTDDNGKKSQLTIAGADGVLTARMGGKEWTLPGDLMTTSPWTESVVRQPHLIDTDSGKAVTVTNTADGEQTLNLADIAIRASCYKQRGGDERDLCFAADGSLARMVTRRDGATITVVLRGGP